MGLFDRLFGRDDGQAMLPLYDAVVARAREPHWYVQGRVPDTVDGRFDAVAAVLSAVLVRMEDEPDGGEPAARLAERFVDDMDPQLREMGIGDMTVGRHVGRMMSMLGGRLGAYRDGLAGGDLDAALLRNLYRGRNPGPDALGHVATELRAFRERLRAVPLADLIEGRLP